MDVVPSTRYVFISGSATAAACAKDCASNCAYFTKTKDDLRTALFNAIGS
jgi:hypothetical protein